MLPSGSMPVGMRDEAAQIAKRLFVALDYPDAASALAMAEQLAPLGVSYKVGMQLIYAEGMSIIRKLQPFAETIFTDLKLHDIPNTVAGSVDSLVRQGIGLLNVHAQGGPEMMAAAVKAARETSALLGRPVPRLVAVTLLTSLSEWHLREYLFVESASAGEYVQHLALQAKKCGMDGVVCSAQEAVSIREACGPDFLLITPGIRPSGAQEQDQFRVITPAQALRNGADYLVIGRPITGASNPFRAAESILEEMRGAMG